MARYGSHKYGASNAQYGPSPTDRMSATDGVQQGIAPAPVSQPIARQATAPVAAGDNTRQSASPIAQGNNTRRGAAPSGRVI